MPPTAGETPWTSSLASAVAGRGAIGAGGAERPGGGRLRVAVRVLVEQQQPLGDDRVGIGLAERDEDAAQPIGVRRRARIAQQQVLGDDAGLLRFAGVEIGLRQLLLRGGQRRVEVAVDADSTSRSSAGDMARRLLQEPLQPARGLAEVAEAAAWSTSRSTIA